MADYPVALVAAEASPRARKSVYPAIFDDKVGERIKRPLGDLFGLTIFGVNITTLKPGAMSALRHAHTSQDEFVYILEGTPTLVTGQGETPLKPGMCAGFKCATGDAHHLINRGSVDVVYLEVGDRTPGDAVTYPDDDLHVTKSPDGLRRTMTRKDGTAY